MTIKENIQNYFKGKISKFKLERYLIMGDYLDKKGEAGLGFSPTEAYHSYNTDDGIFEFSMDEWKEFLENDYISKLLLNEVFKSKRLTLRKIVLSLDETKELTQQQMKALDTLKSMIELSDKEDNNTIYVQYSSPIRFNVSEEQENQILRNYCEDTTGDEPKSLVQDGFESQPTPPPLPPTFKKKEQPTFELELPDIKDMF